MKSLVLAFDAQLGVGAGGKVVGDPQWHVGVDPASVETQVRGVEKLYGLG